MNDTSNTVAKDGINTRLAHCGNNPREYFGFIDPPLVRASTVLFPDADTMVMHNQPYTYGTRGTPTTKALCDAINELEGSFGTLPLPSGLTAVTVPLMVFLSPGDHLLIVDSVFGNTRQFADTALTRLGGDVEYYDPFIGGGIERLLRSNTRVVFTESPGSNTFEIQDVPAIAEKAHAVGATVMMENTWATPLYLKPLELGVDISLHATTKYPSGHSDILMGTVSSNESCFATLNEFYGALGICGNNDDAYHILRGLRTMGLRLERHASSALRIARWLEQQQEVLEVLHPALESHAGHELWKRDFSGSAGIFSFVLDPDIPVRAFLNGLTIFGLGYSWGGYARLALQVNLADRTLTGKNYAGPLVRLQIGLEEADDLIDDIKAAFKSVLSLKSR
uniref:Cystathionine beta-lyase n=1 Tax=Rhizobium leguminosarum TaxID=384 RepID=A0A179C0K5_RHILE|nr:cystathionine beta-lyase [Rhizobium leguminosarum]OAP97638.1 cystathionine beta-lyase [Rhizobium leguminosarum]